VTLYNTKSLMRSTSESLYRAKWPTTAAHATRLLSHSDYLSGGRRLKACPLLCGLAGWVGRWVERGSNAPSHSGLQCRSVCVCVCVLVSSLWQCMLDAGWPIHRLRCVYTARARMLLDRFGCFSQL